MNIKGMDKDMKCRGFQFEIGEEYKINTDKPLKLCTDTVFHYCKSLSQVHNFYDCNNEENRYFEIEVLGEEISDGEKCGSDHIKIVREITGEELNWLKGLDNGNTGLFNSGHCNSGNRNIGNRNSGDYNSGHCNSGDYNSGHCNSGNRNSGNRNSGDYNSGHCNSGDYNSGDYNIGNRNSGDYNSGDYNSGDYNSGNRNSGIANTCDFSNGVFCNRLDKNIRIFNKPSGMSLGEFYDSPYWATMDSVPFNLTEWVEYSTEEKATDPEKEKTGGYLKTYTYKEAWKNWWAALDDEKREIIKQIPNFDKDIFKDITGIEVE